MGRFQRSRIQLAGAALMVVASLAGLVGGHLSTLNTVLYVFVLGLGLFIVAQAIGRARGPR